MSQKTAAEDFAKKFCALSEQNQKYIIAIQQALIFAQESEKAAKKKPEKVS